MWAGAIFEVTRARKSEAKNAEKVMCGRLMDGQTGGRKNRGIESRASDEKVDDPLHPTVWKYLMLVLPNVLNRILNDYQH